MKTGIDIVDVDRFKNLSEDKLAKIFTENEINYCCSFSDKQTHFAGHFSAKEAFVKAIRLGFGKGLTPIDIEISHDKNGVPFIIKSNKIKQFINNEEIELSISHTKKTAIAICILY